MVMIIKRRKQIKNIIIKKIIIKTIKNIIINIIIIKI